MYIQQKIVTVTLLLTVSTIIIGCAAKLTDEQALAESQAISDYIYNQTTPKQPSAITFIKTNQPNNLRINRTPRPIFFPPLRKIGNQNKRLVLLSPRVSLRWMQTYGFKVNTSGNFESISLRKGNTYSSHFSTPFWRYYKTDDPQYLQIGNSKILMTGYKKWGKVFWIYDQYNNIRIVTYE